MPVLVIHLTDIHIASSNDPIIGRAHHIAAAASSDLSIEPTSCLVITSGDVAQSGDAAEYEIAIAFYKTLSDELESRFGFPPTHFVVPGNHDCKFPSDMSAREDVIESVRRKGTTQAREQQLVEVQSDFFNFLKHVCPDTVVDSPWEFRRDLAELDISLVGLNSAMLATLKGDQGKLVIPASRIEYQPKSAMAIYVMHHPLAWLESNNGRDVLEKIRDRADLMLFGHEHRDDLMIIEGVYSEIKYEAYYGDVLQERQDRFKSAFRTVAISDDRRNIKAGRYVWDFNKYSRDSSKTDRVWRTLKWSGGRNKILSFALGHLDWIDDPGAAFTHRKKEKLQLSDLFVWPMLRRNIPDKGQNLLVDSAQLSAEGFLKTMPVQGIAVILGDEQCGKTTLAKRWCLDFRQGGVFPLYLSVKKDSSLKTLTGSDFIERCIAEQYGANSVGDYLQKKAEDRVLLIDDFELIKANSEAKRAMLERLHSHFSRIVVFVSSSPGFELLVDGLTGGASPSKAEIYDFLPLSFKLRSELIEKWLSVGEPGELDTEAIEAVTTRFARIVDDTLGRNLIPSIPIFVLIILQQSEAERDIDAIIKNGSHGFLYQALITQTLNRKVGVFSVDTATTYLTMFAGVLFLKSDGDGVTEAELIDFHRTHSVEYDLAHKFEKIKAQLIAADVWTEKHDKVYFKYPYLFYFFVANFLRQLDAEPRELAVDTLIGSIHSEKSANILLFLAHLSLDPEIIRKLIARAQGCFADVPECNLFESRSVLEKLGANNIRHVYVEYESRKQRLDELESYGDTENSSVPDNSATAAVWRGQEAIVSVNSAFKAMQVLGQLLRNHSGSIKAPVKTSIMDVCVSLGLRTLGALMDIMSSGADVMIEHRISQLDANLKNKKDGQLIRQDAEEFFRALVLNVAVGTFTRIAGAIGSEELAPTLAKVLQPSGGGSRSLVDLAVRLENFTKFPETEVVAFRSKKLGQDEVMPTALVRRFVMRRFYLFPDRKELKTKICDMFKISRKPFQLRDPKGHGH